ncbi:MAG: MBG domain-containing protein [Christensenellales bacterium]
MKTKFIKKHFALACVIALLVVTIASLCACNETSGQETFGFVAVSFDAQDGSGVVAKIVDPSNVTYIPSVREGYDFVGWTLDKDGNQPLDKNQLKNGSVLYGQWKVKTFSVYFYVSDELAKQQTVEYGKSATAPSQEEIDALLKSGETFEGWIQSFDNVKGNLYVYAQIGNASYTVTFVNGATTVAEYVGSFGTAIPSVDSPDKDGFVFDKWVDEAGDPLAENATFVKNATYRATWQLKTPATPVVTGDTAYTYGKGTTLLIENYVGIDGVSYTFDWRENGQSVASGQTFAIDGKNAGTYSYEVYAIASCEGYESKQSVARQVTVHVKKKDLTATLRDFETVYGNELVLPAIEYVGFIDGENESVVDESNVNVVTSYTPTSSVGLYTVTVENLSAQNYDIKGTKGTQNEISATLTVAKRSVSSVELRFSKTYDGTILSQIFDENSIVGLADGHNASLTVKTIGADATTYSGANLDVAFAITDENGTDVSANYSTLALDAIATINPADISYSLPQNVSFGYDATAHGASVSVAAGFDAEYSVDGQNWTSTSPSFVNAGTYDVFFRIRKANYNEASGTFVVAVQKANVTISANAQSTAYGDTFALDSTAFSVAGNSFGTTFDVTLDCSYATGNPVGAYVISVSVADNANFVVSTANGTLSVTPAQLRVRAYEQNIIYGAPFAPTVDMFELTGLKNGDLAKDVIDVETDYVQGASVGNYALSCTLKSDNYDLLVQNDSAGVVVSRRALSVKADDQSVAYGNAIDLANFSYTITDGSLFGNDTLEVGYTCSYAQGDGAGTKKDIIATVNASDNYVVSVTKGTLSVTKRSVSVKADDKSVTYGDDAPAFTYTVTNGSFYGVAPAAQYSCDYLAGYTGASYAISASFADDNHDVSVTDGTLTVGKRTVCLSYAKTVAYQNGQYAVADLALATATGLFDGDVQSGTLTTLDFAEGEYIANEQRFDFVANDVTITNSHGVDVSDAYTIIYDVKVTISLDLIDHTAAPVNVTYDKTAHSLSVEVAPEVSVTYSTDGVTYTSESPSFTNAGTYTVFFRLEQEGKTTTEGSGTITINKRKATVTASAQTAVYGEAFELDGNAYVTQNVIDGDVVTVTLSCPYEEGMDAGKYDISVIADGGDNYDVTPVKGTLTVNAKSVVVTANDFSTTYGEDADLSAFSVDVAGAKQYTTLKSDYAKGSDAGVYAVSAVCSSPNYKVEITGVNLVVAKRTAVVSADDKTVVYGTTPAFTYTASNLFGQDGVSVSFVCDGKNASATGYAITPVVAEDKNYTFETQNGVLVITKATLTVELNKISAITYGDAMPEASVAGYVGFKYDDTASVVNGTLVAACAYTTNPAATTFDVVLSGLECDNYVVEYPAAQLVVNKATLSVTLDDAPAITYGDDVPAFDFAISGFKYSDGADESFVRAIVRVETSYVKGANASSTGYPYYLVCDSETDNYTLSLGASKNLVVNKARYTGITHNTIEGGVYAHNQLSAYSLQANFVWDNPSAYPACNVTSYLAHYNQDPTNYETFDLYIELLLSKATPSINATVNDDNCVWTGSAIDLAALVSATSTNLDDSTVTIPALSGTDGGYYTIVISTAETTNYLATSKTLEVRVKAAQIGDVYYTVEEAVATGGTITLVGNAFVSKNCTLASGSTLILPSSEDTSTTIGTPTYGAGQKTYVDTNASYIEHKLTINDGVSVTVNGNILIQGLLGAAGGVKEGHTSGKHSQLINNGTLTFNSGANLDARGYVKGSGTAYFNSGSTVYSPFVVLDFRGGTNTVTVFKKSSISPFNQYEMPNVQCTQYFYAGSTHTAYVDLYAGGSHNTDKKAMVGSSGVIRPTNGYLLKTYDAATQKTSLTIVGEATMGSLSLTVKLSLISETVNMSDAQFPIPWTYDIHIGDGSTASSLTTTYDYKILPGASLAVENNATLTTSKSIIVYSSFTDTTFGGAIYPTKPAAQFVVNGTYNLNGSFGGNVQSTNAGAKVVVAPSATLSVNSIEGNSGGTSSKGALTSLGRKFVKVFDITETARFGEGECTETITAKTYTNTSDATVNYNEVVRSYSGGTALAQGTTYTYNGSSWA